MNEFERRVAEVLEKNGWYVVAKGKGYDLLALKKDIALVIECKGWNRSIGGKTLRKVVRKLQEQVVNVRSDLLIGKYAIPVLVVAGSVRDRYRTDPVLVFDFTSFKKFLEV